MAAVEEAPPPEPTEPTEPEPPQTDEPSEDDEPSASAAAERDGSHALIEKAERANRNYTKRLREIFGADTTLYDCVHCNGLGITFEPEQTDGVPSDVKMAENLEVCEHCNGYGLNLTPSKNEDHMTAVCTKCSGIGYLVKTTPAPVYEVPTPAAPAADTPIGGQWVPGRGFIPYGQTEPLPNTVGLV
jgi:hypothetical protein